MDLFVIISAITSFIIFFCLKIIILRSSGAAVIIKSLFLAFVITSVLHLVLFGFITIILYSSYFSIIVSYVMFGLLAFIFTLGFLGLATTSLRVQLLLEIHNSGERGISYLQLLKDYNRDIIVKKRLDRLVAMGEIEKIGKIYQYKKHFTYFRLHTFVLILLSRIYKVPLYGNLL